MTNTENLDVATAIEVVAGNPTPRELAAVVAVLTEAASANEQAVKPEHNWASESKMLREVKNHGAGEWRSDFKGQI